MKQSPHIQQLEALLRSSTIVAGGFMGTDPRPLIEIIEADVAEAAMLGHAPAQIGQAMAAIAAKAVAGLGTPVAIRPGLEAVAEESRGLLVCPWTCHVHPSKTVTTVAMAATGVTLRWSDLSMHMIAAHGFFQGRGSAFRLEPRDLVAILFTDKEIPMDKYTCQACGYVYDPQKGDKASNIPPKTQFDQVPEAWKCPMCGAPKRMFKKKK